MHLSGRTGTQPRSFHGGGGGDGKLSESISTGRGWKIQCFFRSQETPRSRRIPSGHLPASRQIPPSTRTDAQFISRRCGEARRNSESSEARPPAQRPRTAPCCPPAPRRPGPPGRSRAGPRRARGPGAQRPPGRPSPYGRRERREGRPCHARPGKKPAAPLPFPSFPAAGSFALAPLGAGRPPTLRAGLRGRTRVLRFPLGRARVRRSRPRRCGRKAMGSGELLLSPAGRERRGTRSRGRRAGAAPPPPTSHSVHVGRHVCALRPPPAAGPGWARRERLPRPPRPALAPTLRRPSPPGHRTRRRASRGRRFRSRPAGKGLKTAPAASPPQRAHRPRVGRGARPQPADPSGGSPTCGRTPEESANRCRVPLPRCDCLCPSWAFVPRSQTASFFPWAATCGSWGKVWHTCARSTC